MLVKSPERTRLTEDTRDTHGGKNRDTPIGHFVFIGNFRRRLARERLVYDIVDSEIPQHSMYGMCMANPKDHPN